MKNIELFWNIVYYGIYKFDVYLRHLVGYLNPFTLIHKIRGVKKYYSEHDVDDVNKVRNRILGNRRTGISSIRSGAAIGGILVLFEYCLFNLIQRITQLSLIENIWQNSSNFITYLVILLLPVILINHLLLFKNDKYLSYFDEFDKMDERKQRRYYLLSLTTILLIIVLFVLSFTLL